MAENLSNFLKKFLCSYDQRELSSRPVSYFHQAGIGDDASNRSLCSVLDKNSLAALLSMPGICGPDLMSPEVEIAWIKIPTISGLTYSLRAKKDGLIRYRLASTIPDMVFELPISESEWPLRLIDVITQYEAATPAVGLTDLVHALLEEDRTAIVAGSVFYGGLASFYKSASQALIKSWPL
jgi:hypothetical protein